MKKNSYYVRYTLFGHDSGNPFMRPGSIQIFLDHKVSSMDDIDAICNYILEENMKDSKSSSSQVIDDVMIDFYSWLNETEEP